ncbi:hypothetical protein [Arthrobacter mobilis]|uniref:Uncharacterized protein n=1 Tax=Arthrobacter mobilis TaxID=2724944 RepID=A0A7X6HE94_9MICC|nr:hypothetical protein [Arthrobacter mobilis]NKX55396.1 hypothetical protein [Arthrobacter mobilis]
MDVLAAISIDGLRNISWILALSVGLSLYLWHPRKLHWAALGAVAVFIAASLASGIYVLAHRSDPRWSAGSPLSAPSLSGTPLVGEYLEPLDALMHSVVGGVNDLRDFQQAMAVALDFFTMAGWGCLAAVPVALFALAASYLDQKRRKAELTRYKSTVEDLQQQLTDLKRFVNYPE